MVGPNEIVEVLRWRQGSLWVAHHTRRWEGDEVEVVRRKTDPMGVKRLFWDMVASGHHRLYSAESVARHEVFPGPTTPGRVQILDGIELVRRALAKLIGEHVEVPNPNYVPVASRFPTRNRVVAAEIKAKARFRPNNAKLPETAVGGAPLPSNKERIKRLIAAEGRATDAALAALEDGDRELAERQITIAREMRAKADNLRQVVAHRRIVIREKNEGRG